MKHKNEALDLVKRSLAKRLTEAVGAPRIDVSSMSNEDIARFANVIVDLIDQEFVNNHPTLSGILNSGEGDDGETKLDTNNVPKEDYRKFMDAMLNDPDFMEKYAELFKDYDEKGKKISKNSQEAPTNQEEKGGLGEYKDIIYVISTLLNNIDDPKAKKELSGLSKFTNDKLKKYVDILNPNKKGFNDRDSLSNIVSFVQKRFEKRIKNKKDNKNSKAGENEALNDILNLLSNSKDPNAQKALEQLDSFLDKNMSSSYYIRRARRDAENSPSLDGDNMDNLKKIMAKYLERQK